jgi:hypothetical protein
MLDLRLFALGIVAKILSKKKSGHIPIFLREIAANSPTRPDNRDGKQQFFV